MALSIDNIYSSLSSSSSLSNSSSLTSSTLSSLASSSELQGSIEGAQTDEELLSACKEFESYMLQQVFKNMQESAKSLSSDEEEEGSEYTDMFGDMLLEEYANNAVESQDYGIAQMLYDSMKRNSSSTTAETTGDGQTSTTDGTSNTNA